MAIMTRIEGLVFHGQGKMILRFGWASLNVQIKIIQQTGLPASNRMIPNWQPDLSTGPVNLPIPTVSHWVINLR